MPAFARQPGTGRVVRAALVAVEAVASGIEVHRGAAGMGALQRLDALHRDVRVLFAEVAEHRAPGCDGGAVGHATAVVRHRGRQAFELARSQPGEQAAPAIADDAHPARVLDVRERRTQVEQRLVVRAGRLERAASLDVGSRIAEFDARLDAVEQGRRDRQITLGGIVVGHRADVRVQAEDLLHDDHRAASRPGRRGQPGAEAVPIGGGQRNGLTHGEAPVGQVVQPRARRRCTKSSRSCPQNSSPLIT
jgi:hypothetical protein